MFSCYYCKKRKSKGTKLRIGDNSIVCRECNTDRKKKYRESATGKSAINRASTKSRIKHKEKWIARAKVRYAVKKGTLAKPTKCEVCEKKKPLQWHHEDYSKPLEVIWLCSGCHADEHNS